MDRWRRAGAVLVAVAWCAALVVGPAAAQPPPRGDGQRWLEATRAAAHPGTGAVWSSPDGAGRPLVTPTSVRPLRERAEGTARNADAWRAAWEHAGGDRRPAIDLATWLAAADVAFAQADPAPDRLEGLGFIQQVVPAGDLDGDGIDDVLAAGQLYDEDTGTAHALSGADGHELWRVEGAGHAIPTLLPLAPGGDFLDTTYVPGESDYTGHCEADSNCVETRTASFSWWVRVRDGATGEARWERSFPGSEESSHSSTSSDQAFAFASTTDVSDQSVVTLPGPDVDGDGLPEVLVSRGDVHREYEEQYEYAPFGAGDSSYRETLIATNVFEVLSGATGEPLASKVVPDVAAVGVLRDAGDLDDDGQPDLLIEHRAQPPFQQVCTGGITVSSCETSGGSSHLEVERLDGRTLVPQWRASAPEGSEAALQGTRADFDGDGVLDLLVSEYRYDRPESAITAVSGDDGAILWRHASTGYLIVEAVAFLDGDGDADVLAGLFPNASFGPVQPTVTIERLDGSSGAVLLSTTLAPPPFDPAEEYAFAQLSSPGDGDGDGAADVAVSVEIYRPEDNTQRRSTVLESARTGAVIFQRDDLGGLSPAGDLDGDGGADALGLQIDPTTLQVSVEAVRLRDGTRIWRQVGHGGGGVPAGDHDGDGLVDLVRTESFYGVIPISRVVSVNGEDGLARWSFPPLRPVTFDRLAGDDRITTAIAVSARAFSDATDAVVARADAYPDALAGAPLAAVRGGPLLLTGGEGLDGRVAAELERLGVERVALLGGESALAPAVAADLAARGLSVERIAGMDRFETAALVADQVVAATGFGAEVLLVQGSDPDPARGWPDAVSASAFGASFHHPVLLSETGALPEATAAALDRLGTYHVRIVGGPPAIADAVVATLQQLGRSVERLAGANRFATARVVATVATQYGADSGAVWVATGRSFPDALAAGAAVGATSGVLLLVDGPGGSGASDAGAYLSVFRPQLYEVHLIGGPDVVSPEVEEELRAVTANP